MTNELGLQGQVTVFGHRSGSTQPVDSIDDEGIERLSIKTLRDVGDKSVYVGTLTAANDNTIIAAPGAGQRLRVYWVSAVTDPDEDTNPLIRVLWGNGSEIYRGFVLSHWESFVGPENQPLIVNLSQASSVAVTVHYTTGSI